jgi:WD40 repeat protein/serine/threonine protein kinase
MRRTGDFVAAGTGPGVQSALHPAPAMESRPMSEPTVPPRPDAATDPDATRATALPDADGTVAPGTVKDPDPDATNPDPGRTVASTARATGGRAEVPGYEILGEIGHGAMGKVYLARQLKLNRVVALKMILAGGHAGPEEVQRFLTEAEAVAQLQHPNIVQIFESGEADGLPYFSLEYVAGGNLAERVRQQPLPPRDAALLVEQLARGVAYAHAHGVVHRDLKPENVLLAPVDSGSEDGGRGSGRADAAPARQEPRPPGSTSAVLHLFPKIADFGLAKRVELDPEATRGPYAPGRHSGHTHAGAVVGTPSYMAPEQARGDVRNVGPLADVYALGAILYRVLTGRPPFQAASTTETLLQVISDEPVPPSQLQPGLPRDLETITLKCLQKEPSRRYGSAQELAEDLRRYLAGEHILARPVGRVERAAKWVRRNKGLSAGLAAAVLALVTGTALALWQAAEATEAAAVADDARKEAVKEKTDADLAREAATRALKTAQDEKEAAQQAREKMAEAFKQAKKELRRFELMHYLDHIAGAAKGFREWDLISAEQHLDECRSDFWHAEYAYLRKQIAARTVTFQAHQSMVTGLALSPDCKRLYSCSTDKTVRVWDLSTRTAVATLRGHCDAITCIALSADSQYLCSGSWDGIIRVWDTVTLKAVHTFDTNTAPVLCLAITSDSSTLYSASHGGKIKVWDLAAGRNLPGINVNAGHCLALSTDGNRLFSDAWNGTIAVWDVKQAKPVVTLRGHSKAITSLVLSSDGSRLYSSAKDATILMWDLTTNKSTSIPRDRGDNVQALALSADGKRLYSAGDSTIIVWDLEYGKEALALRGHTGPVATVAVSPDRKRLCSAAGSTIRVWDADPQNDVIFRGHTKVVQSLALSVDGKGLFSGSGDTTIKYWDLESGNSVIDFRGHSGTVTSLAVSLDGKRLYSTGEKSVKVWNLATGKEITTLVGDGTLARCLALTPDGTQLHCGGADGLVRTWNLATGEPMASLTGHSGMVSALATTTDGKRLLSASGKEVIIWDLVNRKRIVELSSRGGSISCLALSRDGMTLFTGNSDSTVTMWDIETRRPLLTMRGHHYGVVCLTLSPDGKRLFSGSNDGTIRIWDTEAGKECLTLVAHGLAVVSLVVAADGKKFYSGGSDGTVKTWDIAAY